MKRALIVLFLATALLALPGARSDVVTVQRYTSSDLAISQIKAGMLDLYFWRVGPQMLEELQKNPNVNIYLAAGGLFDILVNPAPLNGTFNPFTIREVRFALNYLLDRQYIVSTIMKGYGFAIVSPLTPVNPDYVKMLPVLAKYNFKYNFEKAKKMIFDALTKAGAKYEGGKWYYNGKPIVIKFFIRNDDPLRKQIGDYLADQLEKLGFTVERIYGDFRKAYKVVYASDPAKGEWLLYTEGWGSSGMTKYNDYTVVQMYCPFFGVMPGWAEPTYWNYQNKQLDELGKKLVSGAFKTEQERNELLAKILQLGIEEAVRIFVASPIEGYPVYAKTKGVVVDLQAGTGNHWTFMLAYRPGSPELKIGARYVHIWAWNPVAGYQDWYGVIAASGLFDPIMAPNPYTGDQIPLRGHWEVKCGNFVVPTSAITYDYKAHKWVHVKPGTTAKTMIVLKLKLGPWHNGQMATLGDYLYSLYMTLEWGTKAGKDDVRYDPYVASVQSQFIKTFKGVQVIPPNTLIVYTDMSFFDKDELANRVLGALDAGNYGAPWELYYATEKLVEAGKVAYSQQQAEAKGVDWLDMLNPDHVKMLENVLKEMIAKKEVPEPIKELEAMGIPVGNPIARYKATLKFLEEHGHAVIGNGPVYLDKYVPTTDTIILKAFRDGRYPFQPKDFEWLAYSKVKFAEVTAVKVPPVVVKGQPAQIMVSVVDRATKEPLKGALVYVSIYDSNGNLVCLKKAEMAAPGEYVVTLGPESTAKLAPGNYLVDILAYSNQAFWPSMASATMIVVGG